MEKKLLDEEKLKKIEETLSKLVSSHDYMISTEKGKILFQKVMLISTMVIIFISPLSIIFGGAIPINFLFYFGIFLLIYVFFTEIIIKNYYVIDYEKGKFYFDKRIFGKSISQKLICNLNNVTAVGVDNKLKHFMKGHNPEDYENGYVEHSAVALLKNDGKIIYFNELVPHRYSYENNCIIADALSEILNIPKLNCPKGKQLKVIKNGLNYELSEEQVTTVPGMEIVVYITMFIGILVGFSIMGWFVIRHIFF